MDVTNHFCIARQAICDAQLKLCAYELLYRASADAEHAEILDPHEATARVTSSALLDYGLEKLAPGQQIYINMSSHWLKHSELLPNAKIKNRIVLQVMKEMPADEDLLAALKQLREKGFLIALDDYHHNDLRHKLLPETDIVIVETQNQSLETLRQVKASLNLYPVKTLAEKIETWQDFDQLKQIGFDFYQGYFLSRPETLNQPEVSSNRMVMAKLLTMLFDDKSNLTQIEALIAQEPSLYYRLMKFINSPAYNLPNQIDSLHQAVVYMGMETLRTLVSILIWARNNHKAYTVLPLLLTRAKACELLAKAQGLAPADKYFSLGFLSLLDVALDQPLPTLIDNMSLSDEMQQALLHNEGPSASLLNLIRLWERADWELLEQHPLYDPHSTPQLMLQAFEWANNTEQQIKSVG